MGIFPDDLEQVYDNVTDHKGISSRLSSLMARNELLNSLVKYPSGVSPSPAW